MGILDDDVARVRESTDLVALVSEHLALKRVGRNYMGRCPFHEEKTPSFSVSAELGVWHCFGCQMGGDAITFAREIEHLDFVDAVERLAARASITLHYDDASVSKDRKQRTRLVEAVGAAIDVYHHLLLESPDAGRARRYLRSRGFDGDAVRRFSLGWAPDSFDVLSRELQRRGLDRADLVGARLAFVNRVNKLQDQFRNRLMFPIWDSRGDPVGFGGRSLDQQGPKYLNSPESTIYQKSRLLYGLNWAKGEIVERGEVVVCEGYTDVMAFALAGVPHAVATCGTALADDHFQVLKNLTRRVVLAYDADAAGQAAAERCYQWEQRHEVEFRVADLPPGRDPGDLWPADPTALVGALERATPFLRFRLDRLLGGADRSSFEGRARAGAAMAIAIAEHPNELVRDQYIVDTAAQLGLEPDGLRAAVARRVGGERARLSSPASPASPTAALDRRELEALRLAVHEPSLVADRLEAQLFRGDATGAAFRALSGAGTFAEALGAADAPIASLLQRLAVEEPELGDDAEATAASVVANLTVSAARDELERLVRAGDDRAVDLQRELEVLHSAVDVSDWATARDVSRQLLRWILVPVQTSGAT